MKWNIPGISQHLLLLCRWPTTTNVYHVVRKYSDCLLYCLINIQLYIFEYFGNEPGRQIWGLLSTRPFAQHNGRQRRGRAFWALQPWKDTSWATLLQRKRRSAEGWYRRNCGCPLQRTDLKASTTLRATLVSSTRLARGKRKLRNHVFSKEEEGSKRKACARGTGNPCIFAWPKPDKDEKRILQAG